MRCSGSYGRGTLPKLIDTKDSAGGLHMKVVEVSLPYGIQVMEARRLTEEEKKNYAEWYQEKGFIATLEPIKLDEIHKSDVIAIVGDRSEDGSFNGSGNTAFIISDASWDKLISLNAERVVSKQKAQVEEEIALCKAVIEACEKQEKLYTKEEAALKRKQYNDLYNEDQEGYVPDYYTVDQYNYYKDRLVTLITNNKS